MAQHLDFEGVKGYATYANAKKRGEEVAASLNKAIANSPKAYFTWLIIAKADGRFLPVFAANGLPGGPGMLIGKVNVGIIN